MLQGGLGPTGRDFQMQIEIAELELEPFRKNLTLTDEQLKADPDDEELRKFASGCSKKSTPVNWSCSGSNRIVSPET